MMVQGPKHSHTGASATSPAEFPPLRGRVAGPHAARQRSPWGQRTRGHARMDGPRTTMPRLVTPPQANEAETESPQAPLGRLSVQSHFASDPPSLTHPTHCIGTLL